MVQGHACKAMWPCYFAELVAKQLTNLAQSCSGSSRRFVVAVLCYVADRHRRQFHVHGDVFERMCLASPIEEQRNHSSCACIIARTEGALFRLTSREQPEVPPSGFCDSSLLQPWSFESIVVRLGRPTTFSHCMLSDSTANPITICVWLEGPLMALSMTEEISLSLQATACSSKNTQHGACRKSQSK